MHYNQYADGTALSLVSNDVNVHDEEGLVNDLENVASWVKVNKLKLNVKKSQLMLFSRKQRAQELEHVEIRMNGQNIKSSRTDKCLGVLLDD